MNDKEHQEHYYREKNRVLGLAMSTQIDRDKTIVQLSAISLTILAGFGERILSTNKVLAITAIILFAITIVVQTLGFWTTTKGFDEVSSNMDKNIKEGRRFFDPDYAKTSWSKLNVVINMTAGVCFLAGFIMIAILIIQAI